MSGPYDPPKSVVADSAPALREKPIEARRAVTMLWVSLGLGVVNLLLEPRLLGDEASRTVTLVVTAGTFAIYGLLTAFISAGHNWARIVFLILFVVGCLPYIPVLLQMFELSTLVGVSSIVQFLLQLAALVLIFIKPGSLWFRKNAS